MSRERACGFLFRSLMTSVALEIMQSLMDKGLTVVTTCHTTVNYFDK
jgi:hypothetical protein